MLESIFFLGAAFGISVVSLMELLIAARRAGRVTTRMALDMCCDAIVILLTLGIMVAQ